MAGNSQRKGAVRKGTKTPAGSGGRVRRGLEGRGPTPKAVDRPYHKAYRQRAPGESPITEGAVRRSGAGAKGRPTKASGPKASGAKSDNLVIGRNPVLEALQAGLPVAKAYVADGVERDDRLRDILKFAAENGLPMLQVSRQELDRITGGAVHQGVALKLPEYEYAEARDFLATSSVVVACDGITDPRNLGAIIRSAAAFGAAGVVIPSRRSAAVTAATWKTSAGAAARLPVAKVGNLNQALRDFAKAGFTIVGLAGEAEIDIAGIPGVDGPLVLVVGSEGDGLARLVRENCDVLASIPITGVESLNASVAASIALYEIARCRG